MSVSDCVLCSLTSLRQTQEGPDHDSIALKLHLSQFFDIYAITLPYTHPKVSFRVCTVSWPVAMWYIYEKFRRQTLR